MPKTTVQIRRAALVIIFSLGLGFAGQAAGDSLTLQWTLNTEPEVTGYSVYIGTESGVYPQSVDVGNTGSFVFSNAVAGQQYFFAVSAYSETLVSPLSSEVVGFSNAYPILLNPGSQTSTVGQSISVPLAGSDPLGDSISYSVTGLPPGLVVSQSLGWITGTVTTAGAYSITATVSDGVLAASQPFTWTVGASNSAPTLASPGSQTGTVGQSVVLQLGGNDSNGDPLTYSASGLPPGLQLTGSTGRITGTAKTVGAYAVTASVSDGALSAQRSFTWTIQAVASGSQQTDVAPVLTNPGNQSATVGQAVMLQMQASDSNGQTLIFAASGLPAGLQVTSTTGVISGTPTIAGAFSVTVTVSDGALTAQLSFTWTVAAAPPGPTPDSSTSSNSPSPTSPVTLAANSAAVNRQASSGVRTGTAAVARPSTGGGSSTAPGRTGATAARTPATTVTTAPNAQTPDRPTAASVLAKPPQGQSTSAPGSVTPDTTSAQALALAGGGSPLNGGGVAGDNMSVVTGQTATTLPASSPGVRVATPVNRAIFVKGTLVLFSAVASDQEDGDVTSRIVWSSNVDGRIGTGGEVLKVLTTGTHTITAAVTDSRGTTRTSQILVVVG